MPAEVHTLTVGDTNRPIEAVLEDSSTGADVDLTGCTVVFRMTHESTGTVRTGSATVVGTATDGRVRYDFVADDVATAGLLSCRWVVTNGSAKPAHHPSSGPVWVYIAPTA